MIINVTKPFPYSPDGNIVKTLDVGEYEVEERWANKAISNGHAVSLDCSSEKEAAEKEAAEKVATKKAAAKKSKVKK